MKHIPDVGPLSINVPGAVDGWFEALERFGTLSAEAIFAPAIAFAEEGFPVSPKLSGWLNRSAEKVLKPWESSAGVYLAGGKPFQTREMMRQLNLARTYS